MEGNIGEVPEVPKDDTAPSGDTSAQDKGNDAEEKEPKKTKVKDKGKEVDKGKKIVDTPTIDTPKDKGKKFLPQILINLDGPLYIGKMSPAEKMMVATAVQAQANQDLVKSESEDKKLIHMSIDVL